MTTNAQDIQSAKRTIDKEIEALRMMEDQLDDSLCKALDVMQKTTGRVIITGMGKSGHIGSKIAATLASTGTPSFFVHPGEASHGDLGMLTASDSVVAISNSGETKELSDIIIYCKRYGIPLIAITKILTVPLAVPETFSSSCRMTAKPVPWAWLRHRRQRQPWCWEIFSPLYAGAQRLLQNRLQTKTSRRQARCLSAKGFRPYAYRRRHAPGRRRSFHAGCFADHDL